MPVEESELSKWIDRDRLGSCNPRKRIAGEPAFTQGIGKTVQLPFPIQVTVCIREIVGGISKEQEGNTTSDQSEIDERDIEVKREKTAGVDGEVAVVTVFDVVKYILEKIGVISTMKLQKLVYYAQAWSLVWDEYPDAPLFQERIEAWANGPVVPVLYEVHKGRYNVQSKFFRQGDVSRLSDVQKDTIDRVVEFYGDKSSQWLSDLTHQEAPWCEARKGIPDGERGSAEITHESMAEYYGNI